jgi:hypothetical protein
MNRLEEFRDGSEKIKPSRVENSWTREIHQNALKRADDRNLTENLGSAQNLHKKPIRDHPMSNVENCENSENRRNSRKTSRYHEFRQNLDQNQF